MSHIEPCLVLWFSNRSGRHPFLDNPVQMNISFTMSKGNSQNKWSTFDCPTVTCQPGDSRTNLKWQNGVTLQLESSHTEKRPEDCKKSDEQLGTLPSKEAPSLHESSGNSLASSLLLWTWETSRSWKTNERPDTYDSDDLHFINRIQEKKLGFIREDPWHLKEDRPWIFTEVRLLRSSSPLSTLTRHH